MIYVLTQEELKRILHYDPETGIFTRSITRRKYKAGSIAGTLDNGYIRIIINKKHYQAHRLAFLYMTGKFPEKDIQVDHINQVRDDNRWVNLRLVTNQENQRNSSMYKNNNSGQTGVCWHDRAQKYQASIRVNEKQKHLGYFDNLDDAIAARKAAEFKYNYHENHGKEE